MNKDKNTGMTLSFSSEKPRTYTKKGYDVLEFTEIKVVSVESITNYGRFNPIQPYNVFRIDERELNNEHRNRW